jgi:hypothetical protein
MIVLFLWLLLIGVLAVAGGVLFGIMVADILDTIDKHQEDGR